MMRLMHMRRVALFLVVGLAIVAAAGTQEVSASTKTNVTAAASPLTVTPLTPVTHVVVIMQENHTFDNVLGKLCVDDARCNGTLTGKVRGGAPIALHQASDLIPAMPHSTAAQTMAVDEGRMDGFSRVPGCTAARAYACYSYFDETQIPNLAALARQYVIADAAFTASDAPSWGGHLAMVMPNNGWLNGWKANSTWDGFTGDNPKHTRAAPTKRPGWGCDSNNDAKWKSSPTALAIPEPSCIPDANGEGAYRPTPVAHVPTIMDTLDGAGLDWRIYGATNPNDRGYIWNICPSFAECLAHQAQNTKIRSSFELDATAGTLPAVSFIEPDWAHSQHNSSSMLAGDNYIASKVSAVMRGPEWASTAIFITYDDCGCFYDHVSPNTPTTGFGLRVPMVIVSPYAKPGYTDSVATSSTSGILAFIEHIWALPAIGNEADSYDFSASFDFTQTPLPAISLTQQPLSIQAQRTLTQTPPADPT